MATQPTTADLQDKCLQSIAGLFEATGGRFYNNKDAPSQIRDLAEAYALLGGSSVVLAKGK